MESPLDRFLGYTLCILIFVLFFACRKWFEHSKERKFKSLVAWCATGDYCPVMGRYSYVRELWFAILSAQSSLGMQDRYRIVGEAEATFCKEIIEEYQRDLARKYLLGRLSLIRSKYAIDGRDCFMFTLHDYLVEHKDDCEFIGYDMRRYNSEDTTTSCTPSEFATAYCKLHYITYLYCKNSKITNPKGYPSWHDWEEKHLIEILDAH